MGKKDIIQKNNKISAKKNGFLGTKKRKLAVAIMGAGLLALIAFTVMIFVFDLGPVRAIKSSEEDARVIGECAGFEVRYEELRYLTLLRRDELDSELGKYSELSGEVREEYERELEARVLDDLKHNYAILSLCQKYGVDTDSKDAKTYVQDAIESFVDELGSKKAYREWLDENHMTDAFLRFIYKAEYLEYALMEKLTEDNTEIKYSTANLDDFIAFLMEDDSYIKTIHAFYPKEHEYIDTSNMKVRAMAALSEIRTAENDNERYSAMISAIGKAPFVQGYSVTGTDYYITYGQMHEDYENAAFSLDEYDVSELIELDEGYYIIMRVPKVREEAAPRAYELIDYYRYAILKQLRDAHMEEISFDGNALFEGIKLTDVK